MTKPSFLVADVGGTNTRVALAEGHRILTDTIRRYPNHEHVNLAPLLERYVADMGGPALRGACVAVAGFVTGDRAELTNLDWSIDRARLAQATGAQSALILNDLQAQGHAVTQLPEASLHHLCAGTRADGRVKLVIGVGTGFNAAVVHPTQNGVLVPASEAGHANLPIRTEDELRLCQFVSTAHGFPAIEDVLSGRGLEHVYRWLASEAGSSDEPKAADIMSRADDDQIARKAIQTFVRILGTVTGNLSLIHLPFGGVYLVGGVARAMAPYLDQMGFIEAVRDKGRFAGFMASFPVSLVDDDYAALVGCASHLSEQTGD